MNFELTTHFHKYGALPILERTPDVLEALLRDLDEDWIRATEGPDTWSPFDVVGHLIHGERTDWMPRVRMLLKYGPDKTFEPFDRYHQLQENRGRHLNTFLDLFSDLRRQNLEALRRLDLTAAQLQQCGRHPDFGVVTLQQLLASWTVHDLNHIGQIVRIMAYQYDSAVGPWKQYLGILKFRR